MATQIQLRRGSTSQHSSFTGAVGEATVDTDLDVIRVHDGSTAGGHVMVGTTATQTLTNKTLTKPTLTQPIDNRTQYAYSGSHSANRDWNNVAEYDCSGLTSLTIDFTNADWVGGRNTLFVLTSLHSNFAFTVNNVSWFGGSAPTLPTTGTAAFEAFKVGSTTYAAYIGSV